MSRECVVEECKQPVAYKKTGLCHKHHYRFITNGTTDAREEVDQSTACIADGCERPQKTRKGYCIKHYKSWKRKQPIDTSKTCSLCSRPIGYNGGRGMCLSHYNSWMRNEGNALAVDSNKQRKFLPYGNTGRKYFKNEDGRFTHRAVAEEKLGRLLKDGEIVHHVNMDKLDNSIDNIHVCSSNSNHLVVHRQLEQIAGELVRVGLIGFKDGKYFIDF